MSTDIENRSSARLHRTKLNSHSYRLHSTAHEFQRNKQYMSVIEAVYNICSVSVDVEVYLLWRNQSELVNKEKYGRMHVLQK